MSNSGLWRCTTTLHWVRLTDKNGQPFWFRTDQIVMVASDPTQPPHKSVITLTNHSAWYVTEDPDEVMKLIAGEEDTKHD